MDFFLNALSIEETRTERMRKLRARGRGRAFRLGGRAFREGYKTRHPLEKSQFGHSRMSDATVTDLVSRPTS